MRHYLLPIFQYTHPKGGRPTIVGVVNRKRGMPPELANYEGMLSLFGGAAKTGESPRDTTIREIWNDDPTPELPGLSGVGHFGQTRYKEGYTVTPYYCPEPWTQAMYQHLAASCGEGIVDWVQADDKAEWVGALWATPGMELVVWECLTQ